MATYKLFTLSIKINTSAECTETQNVTLNLQAQNASHVVISDNPDFFDSQWEFFTNPTNKIWNLTGGDSIKAIYVMYKSITGSTSSVVSDSIELNSTGCLPTEVPVEPTPPPPEEPVVPVGGLHCGNLIKVSLDTIYL